MKKTYFPLASGLVDPRHYQSMGIALWLYLWLIDKTTSEEGSGSERRGIVLFGNPVSYQMVRAALGLTKRTCQRHIRQLEAGGYIKADRTSAGYIITVNKSKKWHWRNDNGQTTEYRTGRSGRYGDSSRSKGYGRQTQTGSSREEIDWEAESRRGL